MPLDDLTAAELSQAAYGGDPPVGWVALDPPFVAGANSFTIFENAAAHQIVIAFKGTDLGASVSNILSQATSDILNEGTSAWESVRSLFAAALQTIETGSAFAGFEVMTDGHSLGGGMAQTAALEFGLSGYGQNSLPVSTSALLEDKGLQFEPAYTQWFSAGHSFSEVNVAGDVATAWYSDYDYLDDAPTTLASPYAAIIAGSYNLAVQLDAGFAAHAIAEVIALEKVDVTVDSSTADTLAANDLAALLGASGTYSVATNPDGTVASVTGPNGASTSLMVTSISATGVSDTVAVNGTAGENDTIAVNATGPITEVTQVAQGATVDFDTDPPAASVSSTVTFAGASGVLEIDNPALFNGTIGQFQMGDTIDLTGVVSDTPVELGHGNVLKIDGLNSDFFLQLDPSQNYADDDITVTPDGGDNELLIGLGPNQAPSISSPASTDAVQGAPAAISGLSVTDPDGVSADETLTVTLSDQSGRLSATALGGGSVSGAGAATLTLTGSLAAVNAELATVIYTATAGGGDTIQIDVSDGRGGSAQGHVAIDTTSVTANGGNISWTVAKSGYWGPQETDYWSTGYFDQNGNWVSGTPPGASDDAVISAPGAYTISLIAFSAVHNLTIDDADAQLDLLDAELQLGGVLQVIAGVVNVYQASISGGTIQALGGVFDWNGALDGVTFDGLLNVNGGSLGISGGLVLHDASGAGPGTLVMEQASSVTFSGDTMLDHMTIDIGDDDPNLNGGQGFGFGARLSVAGEGAVLTFEPDVTFDQVGRWAVFSLDTFQPGSGIINDGVMNLTATDGGLAMSSELQFTNNNIVNIANGEVVDNAILSTFPLQYAQFDNTGTINIFDGGQLDLIDGEENSGTINVYNGGVLQLTLNDTEDNSAGKIAVGADSALIVGGTYRLSELGSVSDEGLVEFTGTIDNTGQVLTAGPGGNPLLTNGFIGEGNTTGTFEFLTILNGELRDPYGVINYDEGSDSAVLMYDGVTFDGVLNIDGNLSVKDGLRVQSETGGAGTLNLDGLIQFWGDSQALDDLQLNVVAPSELVLGGDNLQGQTLTLGKDATLDLVAGLGLGLVTVPSDSFVNDGTIIDATYLQIWNGGFVNDGLLSLQPGAAVDGMSGDIENDGVISASGGFSTLWSFAGAIVGSGSIELANDSQLEIGGGVAATQLLAFDDASNNILVLSTPTAFAATIAGFGGGAEIVLEGFDFDELSAFSYADGVLTVGAGSEVATLRFDGALRLGNFEVSGDDTATVLTYQVAPAEPVFIENTSGALDVGQVGAGGAESFTPLGGLGSEWSFHGDGDFLRDGGSDFLIENTAGAVVVGEWRLGSLSYTQIGGLGPEWSFVGTGAYLGDGRTDFLIENASGAVVVGEDQGAGAAYTQVAALGPEWSFRELGDFLGDGKSDFLIENAAGAVVVGEVVGGAAAYTQVAALGPEWKFVGAGDFLDEGHDQFLIENAAGAVDVADWKGGQIRYTQVAALGSEWKFVGAGDYLDAGHDQFLIENASGQVVVGDWSNGAIHFSQVTALGPEWAFH